MPTHSAPLTHAVSLTSLTMALAAWPLLAAAETPPPQIAHEPLRCVRALDFPRVDARVTSPLELKRTRVYFKAHQYPDWYYVDMRALEGPNFLALLPQPLPGTTQVDYYVQALDSNVQSMQTDTYEPEVNRDRCRLRKTPAWRWPLEIILGGTKEGQSPIPPGFGMKGIVSFVALSGAVTTGAGLAAAGSGTMAAGGASAASGVGAAGGGSAGAGLSTTTLVVGGGVAAAAATAAVDALGGGEETRLSAPSITVSPVSALVGFTRVKGTASLNDAGQGTVVFEWDFGDGNRATGASVEHVYQTTGTFTVTVTASGSSGASSSATNSVQVGSLTGVWHNSTFGPDGVGIGSNWRCVQTVDRFDCQSDVERLTTAVGSLRQPLVLDLVYRYLPEFHAFPYNMEDYRCSGDVRADFNYFDCIGGNSYAQGNFGMTRVAQ